MVLSIENKDCYFCSTNLAIQIPDFISCCKAIISALMLCLNVLFVFVCRMRGSESHDFDTAKEKQAAGKVDHACVKDLV